MNEEIKFNTIEEAIEDIRNGKMVVVVDDRDRENEGDLIMASELVRPEDVNFITREARGMLCISITEERARELDLDFMVSDNSSKHQTPFTVSVDAKHGTTTGISAYDRAQTIRVIIDPATRPEDLARPGHIFPLIAKKAVSCGAQDTPKPPWTWRAWPGLNHRAFCVKLWPKTVQWLAEKCWKSLRAGTISRLLLLPT